MTKVRADDYTSVELGPMYEEGEKVDNGRGAFWDRYLIQSVAVDLRIMIMHHVTDHGSWQFHGIDIGYQETHGQKNTCIVRLATYKQ